MKPAGLAEIKKELQLLSTQKLAELCLSLAKYKKDNKEFLGYLLFESHDKQEFIKLVKEEVDELFKGIDRNANLYYAKKSLRKILRLISRYSKYMSDKASSADLYIYFLQKLKWCGLPYHRSQQLENLYEQQLKKIDSLIGALHEDLQGDYKKELEDLR
jgi:membrane-anchored protein YejM (alkaline phosphatase superfamily)